MAAARRRSTATRTAPAPDNLNGQEGLGAADCGVRVADSTVRHAASAPGTANSDGGAGRRAARPDVFISTHFSPGVTPQKKKKIADQISVLSFFNFMPGFFCCSPIAFSLC
jgi:hypothetical protein